MKATILLVCLLPLAASAEPTSSPKTESAEGWKVLFDGQSLAGWRGFKQEAPGKGWAVRDGAIVRAGEAGDLVTVAEFSDFDFRFEWKVAEGSNSGVIYRVGLDQEATYRTGPEYQVLDNVKATDNKVSTHLAGSLYDLAAEPGDFTKPVGEWNEGRIVVRGWHVEHWLNGHKVVDLNLASAEGKTQLAKSKFAGWPHFATLLRGHLALQDHGGAVSFRNLKIRELK